MRICYGLLAVTLLIAGEGVAAVADDFGEPIDLSSLSEFRPSPEQALGDSPSTPNPVAFDSNPGHHRFYLTGIVGGSLATIVNSPNPYDDGAVMPADSTGTLFNGGGAIGVAFSRSAGQLRLEWEQRLRGPMDNVAFPTNTLGQTYHIYTDNAWSTTANLWRDWFVTERLGVYGGAGLGLGGYRSAFSESSDLGRFSRGADSVATWAWQAGTGATFQLTDRVTLDAGYRFFATAPAVNTFSFFDQTLSYNSAFTASELLMSVRIYEPFRNWR